MQLDPRSDRIVLVYLGDGQYLPGVPARDLSEHDLARLLDIRGSADAAELIAELVGSGLYQAKEG